MKLNAASQYFDGGLVQMNTVGDFYYMSTRNNNFSNRLQKAEIYVVEANSAAAELKALVSLVVFTLFIALM